MTDLLVGGCRYECFDPCACSMVDLDKLILESKVAEVKFGEALKSKIYHDWTCDVDAEKKIKRLQTYRRHLEDEFHCLLLGGKGCLNCDELQFLYERVKKLTATCDIAEQRPDIQVTKGNLKAWIAANPYCVAREKWEYLVYDILCDLELEVEIIDKTVACDIVADICANEIPCDIVVAASVCQRKCDLDVKVCAEARERCNLDFEAMVCSKKCDIGLDLHVCKLGCELTADYCARLIDCNLSMDVISCVYQNGCCLSIEDPCIEGVVPEVFIHTENKQYPISTLRAQDIPNVQILSKYGVDLSNSEYLKDPKAFIEKLNKDYSG